MIIQLEYGSIELNIPSGIHPIFDSSIHLANIIDIMPGDRVLDLGCGSGILSIAAAKKGADLIISTDIDEEAIKTTMSNASLNGCSHKITTLRGSWYGPLKDTVHEKGNIKFDVIMATPPQTPGPYDFGPRYGGPDGIRHFLPIIEGAPLFLDPVRGRLWLIAISLVDMAAIMGLLKKRFQVVSVVDKTKRPFTPQEYEKMGNGLFEYLSIQHSRGRCEFAMDESGHYYFMTLYIRASGIIL